jgi:hypothetical protein
MLKDEISKIIMGVVYTADGKPNPLFLGGKIDPKLDRIDEAVESVLKAIDKSEPRKICYWTAQDVEQALEWFNEDRIELGKEPIEYTEEFGDHVLDMVEDCFDANYGVDWDSFRNAIEEAIKDIDQ